MRNKRKTTKKKKSNYNTNPSFHPPNPPTILPTTYTDPHTDRHSNLITHKTQNKATFQWQTRSNKFHIKHKTQQRPNNNEKNNKIKAVSYLPLRHLSTARIHGEVGVSLLQTIHTIPRDRVQQAPSVHLIHIVRLHLCRAWEHKRRCKRPSSLHVLQVYLPAPHISSFIYLFNLLMFFIN